MLHCTNFHSCCSSAVESFLVSTHERALATSVGVLANQMGTCFGLGASIMIDLSMSAALSTYLGVQCFCAGFAALLILIFVTNGHNTINHETPSKDKH